MHDDETTAARATDAGGADQGGSEAVEPRAPRKLRMFGRPTFGGSVVALVFLWRSMYPTLMPRTWVAQAAMTAVCVAIGYALGTLAGSIGHRLLQRYDREPDATQRRAAWIGIAVLAGLVVLLCVVVWGRWQNDQRELVDLGPISWALAIPVLVVAAILTVVLALIGRGIARGVQRLDRFNQRHLPKVAGTTLTVFLVIVIGTFLLRDVLASQLAARANSAFGTVDTGTTEGTVQPTSRLVSGGKGTLIPWDTLGLQGREFVAHATTREQLDEFWGDRGVEVQEPIRVYAGLRSADDAQARADLAVQELDRTKAWDREVLVVTTVTGTGWVDPDASLAIEMLHHGDTAMVAQQYSFLPSWISTLIDKGKATEAGAVLFNTVHDRWEQLPADHRPQLVVFGQSLGSYGAEAAFAGPDAATSVANMVARTEGVLYTGPTNDNAIWRQLQAERQAGSPTWWPVFQDGKHVRFRTRGPDPTDVPEQWKGPRILYIQHPSDPVTFWGFDQLWSSPEWMDSPRGYDVPERGGWFPIVTGVQGVFDLMAGFGAPPGYGHDYRLDFVEGWSQVTPPDGWTAKDTQALEKLLHDS